MMKSDIDIADAIYEHLKGSELAAQATGTVRKMRRKKDSKKEDIVIVPIANENGDVQLAAINVNVYVKDQNEGGEPMPNTRRLRELADIAKDVLDCINLEGYRITLDSQRIVECQDTREYCINNRLNFQYYD